MRALRFVVLGVVLAGFSLPLAGCHTEQKNITIEEKRTGHDTTVKKTETTKRHDD